ncbi:hypothetical protein [Acidihalobacter prosperus]
MSTEHSESTSSAQHLAAEFSVLDERISALEGAVKRGGAAADLPALVEEAIEIVNGLMGAYATHAGKPMPVSGDPLEIFKAFVKGDPSLNAIRDNVRELVYYRNCLAADRADALPTNPALMTAHTARHVYLYLRTRCTQEGRLP